jgi:hypothetical protein
MFSTTTLETQRMKLSNDYYKKKDIYNNNEEAIKRKTRIYRKRFNKYFHLHSYRSKLYDEYYESEKDYDHPDMVSLNKKISKISSIMQKTKKEYKLLDFELKMLEHISEEYESEYDNSLEKLIRFFSLTKKNCNQRCLTKKKCKLIEKEDCPICLDNHKFNNIIKTSCGHIFGKNCFEKLLENNYYKELPICCPLCRETDLTFVIYRKNTNKT